MIETKLSENVFEIEVEADCDPEGLHGDTGGSQKGERNGESLAACRSRNGRRERQDG